MSVAPRRLTFVTVLVMLITACTGLVAVPPATPRTYRIAYFASGGDPRSAPSRVAFVEELARLGYVVDQNLTIEYRWADGKSERLAEFARELAALKFDAVFASSEPPAQALLDADAGVPIVMVT
jgi:putative ABC transport system substrate-binding protein